MGAIIEQLTNKQIQIDRELLGCSHSKLVEYYSSYKSICESFTITLPQYTHIFGPNKLSFEVWDTKNRAKIDALQLFSGIIIFSSIKYEQKVKFLFQLFDFNEESTLGYQNIALMVLNIINASFKVFQIKSSVDSSTVQSFLDEYFTQDSQVELQKLIRWTLKVNSIGEFFKAIGQQIQYFTQDKKICELEMIDLTSKVDNVVYSNYKENIFTPAFFQRIKPGFKLSPKQMQGQKIQKLNLSLEWVFGINLGKQNIKYVWVEGKKAANQRIVYVAGKLIIVYFPKLNIQQYYKQHQLPVSAIQISSNKKIVASGENGEYPHIHIWDFQTKALLVKFKRLHKNSIQFLKFIKNDQLLATASQNVDSNFNIETPIIIVSLQTKQIVTSTYLSYQVLGLGVNHSPKDNPCQFIALGKRFITTFTHNQERNSFRINVKKMNVKQPILCFSINQRGQIFTCQAERRLQMWEEGQPSKILAYTSESTKNPQEIICLGNNHLAILDSEDIQILRLSQNENNVLITRVQRLRLPLNLQFKIDLFHMQAINNSDILLISFFGHVYRINNKENCTSITYQQYEPIFKLIDPICYYDDHHTNKFLIVCQHLIYAIDRYQKDILILMKFEERIKKVASNKHSVFVLSVKNQSNYIVHCLSNIDLKIVQTFRFSENKHIYDILATQHQFMAFSDQNLYLFLRNQDKYIDKQPTMHKLGIEKIRNVITTKQSHTFLIFNQQNQISELMIQGTTQFKVQKIQKVQAEVQEISTYYLQKDQKDQISYEYPFCVNFNRSLIVLGQKNGDLLLWQSPNQANYNENTTQKMTFLCNPVTHITLNKNQISITSVKGQLVLLFKHNHYLPQNDVDSFLDEAQPSSSQEIELMNNEPESKTIVVPKNTSDQKKVYSQIGGNFLKQSQVEISPLTQSNKSELRQLIRDIINPKDKISYQPQLQTQNELNATKLTLQIDGVFGISAMNPLGVFYTHCYAKQPRSYIDKKYWQENHQQENEELYFASNLLLPIDDIHLGCSREFVYSSGRLCVMRDHSNRQRIYQFHRRKITCMAVHPQRQIMMSCEEGDPHPIIHIWDNEHIACRASIIARHNSAIKRGSFSKQGRWLVTLGGRQNSQSFQIVNWQDEEIVNFVPIENECLCDVLFNPYNDRELTVLGKNIIKVYEQQNARQILVNQCRLEQQFLCATYTSSIFGNKVESDLITGSRTGDIGIYICGKFIPARSNAHSGAILCLRLAELFGYKKVLISGGQEGMIKIWDIKFNELARKDIKEEILAFNFNKTNRLELGISSIDIYQCMKVHETDRPPSLLLITTTDGSVLEAKIKNQFQGYKSKSSASKQVNELKQKINFDVSVVFNGPPSLPGTKFEVFGDIMITYNNWQKHIQIWNLLAIERIGLYSLPNTPAIIRFMNNSPTFLAIFNKETLLFFQLYRLQINNKLIKNISLSSEVVLPKGCHQIVQAIFSAKDNKIALTARHTNMDEILLYILKEQRFELNGKIEQVDQSQKASSVNYRSLVLQFSSEGEGLLVGWTDCSLELLNQSWLQKQYLFRCYHVETKEQLPVTHFDFKKIDFSRRIKVNYLPCNHLGRSDYQKMTSSELAITCMTHFDCFLLLGTANGEIVVVEADYFLKKQKEAKKLLRYFVIQDSPITSLYVRDQVLYVSSQKGESIIKIALKCELGWGVNMIKTDIHNQNMSSEWVENKIKNVYQKRRKIQTQDNILDEDEIVGDNKCEITLSLAAILGRNAQYKRNNIFVNFKDQIVYFSGCNIIIMKNAPNQKMQQIIVKPDLTTTTIYPEIAAMALGDCKSKLVVGTAEQHPKLLVWNISTKTFLYQIPLQGYILVTIIKLSSSSKHAAVIAVMPDAVKHLLFINLMSRKVLAVSKLPFSELSINDLCFVQGSQYKILGCGQNLMGQWQYKTGLLIHKRYSLDSSQDLSQIKANGIIFYSIIYIKQMAVTSGSDGYLYMWKDGRLAKRQNAHPKAAVLSLYTFPNSRVFSSGGTDGRVVTWKIWPNLIIQQQRLYPKQGNLALGIQSISMAEEELVVGDVSGSIWIYPFGNEEVKAFIPLMSSFNNEKINSCAFNSSSKKLFVVTANQKNVVIFTVFDTSTFLKLKEEKLDLKSPLIKMICCKLKNRIFFILQNSILGYQLQAEGKDGKEEKGKLLKSIWAYKWQHGIKNAVISGDQQYLAVLKNKQNLLNCIIDIFCLGYPHDKFFKCFDFPNNQKLSAASTTNMIDFCTGHDHLIYQAPDQDAIIFNLAKKKTIKLADIQNQLQWNDQAKKTTPAIAEIIANYYYSEDCNILRLVHVKDKCLIATDQAGSVRVFNYPKSEKKGFASNVYIQHLNEVYICIISIDERLLATVAKEDKAIHLWEIILTENDG